MTISRPKISIVGAGFVGSTAAHWLSIKGAYDIVLVDIVEGVPQGKALDLQESAPVEGFASKIKGTNDYTDTKDSDIVVITAGIARKPGMSRDDLLATNQKIVAEVTKNVIRESPDCILIVVSNPLDAMVYVAYKTSGLPKERVIGMAGILDSARFAQFIAEELTVSVENIDTMVLGGHGDSMVPLLRYSTVAGAPVIEMIPKEKLDKIVQRTRDGGIEIVNLLKTGSAYYAPAAAIAEMVEAITKDKKKILPCSVLLEGEYGANGVFVGVPVKLGMHGAEKIIQLKLSQEEKKQFEKTVIAVHELNKITGL